MSRLQQLAATGLIAFTVASAAPSQAATFNFDFTGQTLNTDLTSTTASSGSLNAAITRPPNGIFQFFQLDSDNPLGWDPTSLDTASYPGAQHLRIDFSTLVSSVTIAGGDFNIDIDSFKLEAFSSTSAPLASQTLSYADLAMIPGETLNFNLGTGLNNISYVIISDADFGLDSTPNSFYWNRLTASTVSIPEPTAVPAPLPIAAAGVAFAYSRKLRRRIASSTNR